MTHVGVGVGVLMVWKEHYVPWIGDEKITGVTATEIQLEYSNPLKKILPSDG